MFHKVKAVNALENYRLSVQFAEGITKIYNVSQLFDKWEWKIDETQEDVVDKADRLLYLNP